MNYNFDKDHSEGRLEDVSYGISSYRRGLGLSQTELGAAVGLGKAQVSKIEKGGNPTISTITKMYGAMGADIFYDVEPKLTDAQCVDLVDDLVLTISSFADRYGLTRASAFKYIDTFGGLQCYLKFHKFTMEEPMSETLGFLRDVCNRYGGKIK